MIFVFFCRTYEQAAMRRERCATRSGGPRKTGLVFWLAGLVQMARRPRSARVLAETEGPVQKYPFLLHPWERHVRRVIRRATNAAGLQSEKISMGTLR